MNAFRVIWLVFFVVNLVIVAGEVFLENRLRSARSAEFKLDRLWWAIPLRVACSLLGPVYIGIQIGAYFGGDAARSNLFKMLEENQHCPICGACQHDQGKVQRVSE